jgi:hypothetical protein
LIAPYRDRTLKPRNEGYSAQDFALCYVCHAEEPLVDATGAIRNDTNFNWHGFHITAMATTGSGGTDIDTFGAGQGNAICSECHFRTHGTQGSIGGPTPAPGLVTFSPNVGPNSNGIFSFTPKSDTSWGSCTLTCHGKNHNAYSYAEP